MSFHSLSLAPSAQLDRHLCPRGAPRNRTQVSVLVDFRDSGIPVRQSVTGFCAIATPFSVGNNVRTQPGRHAERCCRIFMLLETLFYANNANQNGVNL